MSTKREETNRTGNTALTAVALQDHLVKSLGLNDFIGPRHVGIGPAARSKQKKSVRSTIDTGRFGRNKPQVKKKEEKDREYVLDPKPPPLTLAQKFGLVDAPEQPLSETDWQKAKEKSNKRDDSKMPCVICKEDFGTQEQVLLSCTHVFHRVRLDLFCLDIQYTAASSSAFATSADQDESTHLIQACWRGYVVRCMYLKLRESNPPKDPKLRQKFYEEKLHKITDRIVRSCDFNVNNFLREMDQSLEASRNVFRDFDARFHQISEDEWESIQLKAVERGDVDCPICLTLLVKRSYIEKQDQSTEQKSLAQSKSSKSDKNNKSISKTSLGSNSKTSQNKEKSGTKEDQSKIVSRGKDQRSCRQTVLLSCSHVFHETCLEMFEELSMESNNCCPVCRSKYQKKVLVT
ncbi:RING finger protein 32-like [Mercenaria mercenaria]|uniref:RING finger protein 32-like n=1 Tax=Mercenaria mercenaria TaxID=6596 RepID=UPI00234E4243|nr:RING finger protein 32-like [Mercenaria mercenaria]